MRVEAPHPCVIELCFTEFQQSRVSPPGALVLMHLKQPVMDARVNAGGDDALDFHAVACKGVLIVAVDIVGSDAAGVPQGAGGLVLHGVLSPRRNIGPQEFAFGQGFVELSNQDLGAGCREGGDEACEPRQYACRTRP